MAFRNVLTATVATLLLLYHAPSLAVNLQSLSYDESLDKLIIEIAYRGTHANHQFLVQWEECRRLDNTRSQIKGMLIGSYPRDPARQDFYTKLEIDMSTHPCRPARFSIRTSTGSVRSVDIPARPSPPR